VEKQTAPDVSAPMRARGQVSADIRALRSGPIRTSKKEIRNHGERMKRRPERLARPDGA